MQFAIICLASAMNQSFLELSNIVSQPSKVSFQWKGHVSAEITLQEDNRTNIELWETFCKITELHLLNSCNVIRRKSGGL